MKTYRVAITMTRHCEFDDIQAESEQEAHEIAEERANDICDRRGELSARITDSECLNGDAEDE